MIGRLFLAALLLLPLAAQAQSVSGAGAACVTLGTTQICGSGTSITGFASLGITAPAANSVPLTVSNYSLTGSDASSLVSLAGTINTSGSPDVIKIAITDTARGASTKLLNIYGGVAGATTKFSIDNAGSVIIPTATTAGYFLGSVNDGLFGEGLGKLTFGVNGASRLIGYESTGATLTAAAYLAWVPDTGVHSSTSDLRLFRDGAAGILAQRVGTASQIHRIYHSWTDASNGSWAFTDPGTTTANLLSIGSRSNGTGAGYFTKFQIEVDGTNKLDYGVTAASRWTSPAPFVVTVGGFISSDAGYFATNSRGALAFPSDGVWQLQDNNGTSFGRLQFGGTTSSFPAIKRSAALLQARLADDSAYAGFEANTLRTATAYTVATLPAAGSAGRRAYITDQLTTCAVVGATLTGGGAVICPVFDNGTVWVGG